MFCAGITLHKGKEMVIVSTRQKKKVRIGRSSLGSLPRSLLGSSPKNPQWDTPLWGESHHSGVSEKMKEWCSKCQKMRSTTYVEDLVDAVEKETGIQDDSRRDWCGHWQPSQNVYT